MCSRCVTITNPDADAFADRLVGMVNEAAVALMISVGHRAGLFDVLATLDPSTSQQIAEAGMLDERYVREWLGAMVTGRVVAYDPARDTYHLPPEHARWLTRDATPDNIAATMQWIAVLGGVEDRIVECFRQGGGVPYSAYARFHEVMAEESDQTTVSGLDAILPLDGLGERLEQGIDVLDIGCGRGRAMIELATRYPASRFTGVDLSADAVATAQAEAQRRGLTNVTFRVEDVVRLDEEASFDLVTAFDAIHDQADPARVLRNVLRALRRDGVFLMQDIAGSSNVHENMDRPLAPFVYTISCMHCMTVSLAQGGAGLGAAWGEQLAQRMLEYAGFASVRLERLEHDVLNAYFVARAA